MANISTRSSTKGVKKAAKPKSTSRAIKKSKTNKVTKYNVKRKAAGRKTSKAKAVKARNAPKASKKITRNTTSKAGSAKKNANVKNSNKPAMAANVEAHQAPEINFQAQDAREVNVQAQNAPEVNMEAQNNPIREANVNEINFTQHNAEGSNQLQSNAASTFRNEDMPVFSAPSSLFEDLISMINGTLQDPNNLQTAENQMESEDTNSALNDPNVDCMESLDNIATTAATDNPFETGNITEDNRQASNLDLNANETNADNHQDVTASETVQTSNTLVFGQPFTTYTEAPSIADIEQTINRLESQDTNIIEDSNTAQQATIFNATQNPSMDANQQ